MKNLKFKHLFFLLSFVSTVSYATESDSLTKIGDNLDLYAVLETFKTASSIETFEEKLNSKTEKINNLDLNEDGEVDYIQVIDKKENNSHAIILRVDMSETESQDVAVIEIEKTNANTASLQIIGDTELYGTNYILEPKAAENTTESITKLNALIYVNVWHWRPIRHIYSPSYTLWVSPYRWRQYPRRWKPWKPYNRYVYFNFHKRHHHGYHIVHHHHSKHAHGMYKKHRRHCVAIKHHHNHHSHYKSGHKTPHHKHKAKTNKSVKKSTIKKQKAQQHKKRAKVKKKATAKRKRAKRK